MRILTTLLMLLLVAGGVVWLAAGDRTGLIAPKPAADGADAAVAALAQLRPEKVQKIDLTPPGQPTVSLTRNPDGSWSQPGNWPVRASEASSLLNALTGLRTRFHPIELKGEADLSKYGLAADQKPAVAVVQLDGKTTTLRFGQPPAAADDPGFGRPCYVRVDDRMEVVRLGPDVWPAVTRPAEAYRRRQLFPDAERVKLTGGEPAADPLRPTPPVPAGRVALLGDGTESVRIEKLTGPRGSVMLKRTAATAPPRRDPDRPSGEPALNADQLASAWELEAVPGEGKPAIRDRADPAKLKAVLTAVPDLWVEKFTDKTPEEAGLSDSAKPDYAIAVTKPGGRTTTIRLGKVSRTVNRVEEQPPPQPFAPPPPPPKITTEEYRYAKLDDNPLVFEVRSDKLNDLFADPESFRDPRLARFEPDEAAEVTVAVKGQPPVVLTKKKGNKDAEREDDRRDRWFVGDILADSTKVTDLLDQLSRLEAKGESAIDNPDAAKLKELALDAAGATTVTVTAQARTVEGETPPPPRTVAFIIGKDDAEKKKLAVRVAGWPRISLVDDAVWKSIDRPALAYRGRRLFDTAEAKLTNINVVRPGGDGFAVSSEPGGSSPRWKLTRPLTADADESKAAQLAGDLSRLEAIEYVDDDPKPDDLEKKYGLAEPRFAVDLGFTGQDAKPQTLRIGTAREGKTDAYARLNGTGGVFAVPKTVVDELEAGAIGLLPLQLWSVASDKVAGVEIRRSEANGNESYRVAKDGSAWKLTGPFDAPVGFPEVQPLLAATAAVKAEKYEAISAVDPAKYGFDKPALRLTVTYQDGGDEPRSPKEVSKTLVIGSPTGDGAATRFARLDGGPNTAVFALPDSLLNEADKPALGWLDKSILSLDPAKVTKVQIAGPTADDSVTLVRDPQEGWKAEGTAFALDKPTVEALVQTAARPPVARLAAYGSGVNWTAFGLDQPAHTITLTVDGAEGSPPRTHAIKLGKAEANGERYVRADDGPAVGVLLPRAAEVLARGKLGLADRTLFAFDPRTITAITRKTPAGELELARAGNAWEITKPEQQKADAPTLEDLADELSRLRAVKVAASAPADGDLTKYGLAEPAATFTLKFGGDKPPEKMLHVGGPVDPAKPDGERYVRADDGPAVGVISAAVANRLLADPLKFRDKTLAEFPGANRVALERGDRKVTFAKIDGTWKVTDPVTADAEAAALEAFATAVGTLRGDELEADKPTDLKPYGLDNPEAKWTFFADGKEPLVLLVGVKEKAGPRVYAKTEKGNAVALLDPDLTAKALGEFRKRRVWPDADASQAVGLILSSETGSNSILRKQGAAWADTQKPDEPIDQDKVAETAAALAGLRAERFVADKDAKPELYGLDRPTRVLVLTLKDNKNLSLQIGGPVGGTDGKQVYAKAGEAGRTDVFVLSEADTAKLTRDRGAYAGKK